VNDLTWTDPLNGISDRLNRATQSREPEPRSHDHDYANRECGQLLLVLHPAIGRQEDIEVPLSTAKQLAVLKRSPTLLLHGADNAVWKVPPK